MIRAVVIAALILAGAAHAATVVLPEEGCVTGARVMLGDIAKVQGDDAEAVAAIDLGPAPAPGLSRVINAAFIHARAKPAGIPPASIVLKGAAQVKVTALHAEITRDMVVDNLRQHIETHMPVGSAETEIEISTSMADMIVPDGDVTFEWRTNPDYTYVGPGVFRGNVLVDGKNRRSVLCKVDILTYGNIVTAAREIPKGTVVSSADLRCENKPVAAAGNTVFLNPADVVGFVAERTIRAGETITQGVVTAPKIIARNQIVMVEAHAGSLQVVTQAKAAADAAEGDVLRCYNINSKQTFEGIVRKDGVVVVQ